MSLLHVLESCASADISVVGNEGVVGLAVFMGGESTLNSAVVQSTGWFHRSQGVQIALIRELIASRLGVRLEGATRTARELQSLAIIEYARGRITILHRKRLEAQCCQCYAVVKRETVRPLPAAVSLKLRSCRVRIPGGTLR